MQTQLDTIAQVLATRLRAIARALSRLDRLESGSGTWLGDQSPEDLTAAAQGMVLRTLRVAADTQNFAILEHLAGYESRGVAAVQAFAGIDRMTLSERLNDLVQVGLIVREIDTDQVQITDAGTALTEVLSSLREATARHLTHHLEAEKS